MYILSESMKFMKPKALHCSKERERERERLPNCVVLYRQFPKTLYVGIGIILKFQQAINISVRLLSTKVFFLSCSVVFQSLRPVSIW